jgi:hypothetical protein
MRVCEREGQRKTAGWEKVKRKDRAHVGFTYPTRFVWKSITSGDRFPLPKTVPSRR